MSRDNMICVPLRLQPNSDWLEQSGAGLFRGFGSLALGIPQFGVAASGPNMAVNSTSLPILPMPIVAGYQQLAADSDLTIEGGSGAVWMMRQTVTVAGSGSRLTGKATGQTQDGPTFNEICDTTISHSTFNKWNSELTDMGKYPHSRQSGLPPGRVWRNPGSEDTGGTTGS